MRHCGAVATPSVLGALAFACNNAEKLLAAMGGAASKANKTILFINPFSEIVSGDGLFSCLFPCMKSAET